MNGAFDKLRAVVYRVLGASGPLIGGRFLSAAVTFALPLVLARLLTPEAFGTYKQFFLIALTLQQTGQLGLTQSLYYFLPRGGKERGSYVSQTLSALMVLGLVFGVALYFAAPLLGRWLGDGQLATLRVPLALFGGLMVASSALEAIIVSEGRIGIAALAYVLNDGVRAGLLVIGALFFGPTGLFWMAALTSALRLCACVGIIAGGIAPFQLPSRSLFKAQLGYALPFAGSTYLWVAQRYFSQYAVSASFDAATFALFAVASFHMPVVEIVFSPMAEVMMVQIGKAHAAGTSHGVWAAWNNTVQKLATILFPAAACAWLFGSTVLPLLFTHKYNGSVPLFMIATCEIPLWILPLDAVLRSAGDTRFLFAFNGVRIAFTAGLVLGGIHTFGLPGAIAGGVMSEAVCRVLMFGRARRFLECGYHDALDWSTLARTVGAAAAACVPAWALHRLPLRPVPGLLLAGVVYGASYIGLLVWMRRRTQTAPAIINAAAV